MEDDKRLIESYKTNSTGTRILHWKSIIVKFWSRFRKQLLMGLSILMVTLSLCVILSIIFTGGTAKNIWDKKQNIFQTPRNFVRNTELNCRGDCCSVRNISAPYRRLSLTDPATASIKVSCMSRISWTEFSSSYILVWVHIIALLYPGSSLVTPLASYYILSIWLYYFNIQGGIFWIAPN